MGKGFGNLYYIRNVVYYRLSNYEQKAFAGWTTETMRHAFNGLMTNVPVIGPIFAVQYLTLQWALSERERMVRKDPKSIKDD